MNVKRLSAQVISYVMWIALAIGGVTGLVWAGLAVAGVHLSFGSTLAVVVLLGLLAYGSHDDGSKPQPEPRTVDSPVSPIRPVVRHPQISISDLIILRDRGVITEEEFALAVRARIPSPPPRPTAPRRRWFR